MPRRERSVPRETGLKSIDVKNNNFSSLLSVGFLHPDLGLGGAERLVVDAATGLSHLGHKVVMYTSHYDPSRSFDETRSGIFPVTVYGDWLPRSLFGRLHIVFAMMRMLWLALCVAVWHGRRHDVLIVDQVSVCIPLLKIFCPYVKILFYCSFWPPRAGFHSTYSNTHI